MSLPEVNTWKPQMSGIRTTYATAVLINISIHNLAARCLYQIDKLLNPMEKPIMRSMPQADEKQNDSLLHRYIKIAFSTDSFTIERLQHIYDAYLIPLQCQFNEVFKLISECNSEKLEVRKVKKLEKLLLHPSPDIARFYEFLDDFQLTANPQDKIKYALYRSFVQSIKNIAKAQ